MKNNIFIAFALAGVALSFSSCDENCLQQESVITADIVEKTPLDYWLEVNYLQPYNIEIKYRYEYNETDGNYYTVPADYDMAVEMAHIVKYSCVEAYDEVAGIDFTRKYFPKLLYFVGEWLFMNIGNYDFCSDDGGKLKTIHHEFTHILNQTVDYPASFQLITGSGYLADSWSSEPWNTGYLQRGFISAYAQQSDAEDFAETMSIYVTSTPEQWEEWMQEAEGTEDEPSNGREYIEAKLDIVRTYMRDNFSIDLDELRDVVLRRENDIASGKIDLTDVSID